MIYIHQVLEVLYGFSKIHKELEDGTASFCSILSAIGTTTYNLAKFPDQLLKPLTSNHYAISDSFSFAKKVLEIDASLFTASFDIKSFFTNIPLTEMLNLWIQNFITYLKLPCLNHFLYLKEKFMSHMMV